jgi:hypothetical protein
MAIDHSKALAVKHRSQANRRIRLSSRRTLAPGVIAYLPRNE